MIGYEPPRKKGRIEKFVDRFKREKQASPAPDFDVQAVIRAERQTAALQRQIDDLKAQLAAKPETPAPTAAPAPQPKPPTAPVAEVPAPVAAPAPELTPAQPQRPVKAVSAPQPCQVLDGPLLLAHLKRLTGRNFARYAPLPTPDDILAALDAYAAQSEPEGAEAVRLDAEGMRARGEDFLAIYARYVDAWAAAIDGRKQPLAVFQLLDMEGRDSI